MKKGVWLTAIGVVVLAGGFFAYRTVTSRQAAAQAEVQTATVQRGSLTSTLSSSGNTRSGQNATLAWQASGKVGQVSLHLGDLVQADQVLAELDPSSLSTELIQARQQLIDAQQALDDLLNSTLQQALALQAVEDAQQALDSLQQLAASGSSQAQLTLTQAQAALQAAQKNLTRMAYPHSQDPLVIEKAQTQYLLAKAAYKEAQKAFELVDQKKLTHPDRVRALNNLVAAKQKMDTALATYNWYLGGYSSADIAQAEAELVVAQAALEKAQAEWDLARNGTSSAAYALAEATLKDAQREYERVKDGPAPEDIAAAEAAVDAAQAALDHARLLAPFSGTLTQVQVKTGDLVSSGDPAFRIDDLASIYVDLQISEVDLASLQVGQAATLEFDAIPDQVYQGEVTEIGMIGSVAQGVVNYPVTVQVTNGDEQIRPGMTAAVEIVIEQVEDVLLVPNKAIRTSGGQRTVTVLFEGQQISLPVTVGLTGSVTSQVSSDQLREGDLVVLSGTTSSGTNTNTIQDQIQNRRNIDGGGFGPPPGGMFP